MPDAAFSLLILITAVSVFAIVLFVVRDLSNNSHTTNKTIANTETAVIRISRLNAASGSRLLILITAVSVFAIVLFVVWELFDKSRLSLHQFGLGFFYSRNWDPVNGDFGALPFVYGTLVSSFLALLLAVPLS